MQRRLLGVRSLDAPLLRGRPTQGRSARTIATLRMGAVSGSLVSIDTLPADLVDDQSSAVRDIADAVHLCRTAGASVVGLGALAALVGAHGRAVAELSPCAVTTGNALTTWAAVSTLSRLRSVGYPRGPVGVFGLPGVVATGLVEVLLGRGETVVVIHPQPSPPLQRAVSRWAARNPGRVTLGASPSAFAGTGSVLLAASSTGRRIALSTLLPGSVVIDVAEPVDLEYDVPRRDDVLVLDGELVTLPRPMSGSEPWWSIYGWVTGQTDALFACFAEPMLLAGTARIDLAFTGRELSAGHVETIGALAIASGYSVDRLYSRGRRLRDAVIVAFVERARARAGGTATPPPP